MAVDGDTVLIPGSSCGSGSPTTWTSAVNVSTGITLNGQGAYIAFGSNSGLNVNADAGASTRVTNFNFQNGFTNGGCPIEFNISPSSKIPRFDDNTHTDAGSSGPVTLLCVNGLGGILIDHNTLTTNNGADEVIHILGQGPGSDNWTDSLTPGSPYMVYIETNTFVNKNTTYESAAEEAYYGAEFVFRYNTLTFEGNDMHGGDAARWGEIYQNTYKNGNNYAQLRGGSGLYYSNHVSGTQSGPNLSYGPDCPSSDICSGSWPVPKQVGRGINGTTYSPAFAWGNDATIQNNIGPSSGQSIVDVGTATTDATHCSGHPGNVCDAAATTSMPSLVRCESSADVSAGCPVSYTYTAFAYPYPLNANGMPNPTGSSSTAPAPPTNVSGNLQ